jgi:hypothetical protein
MLLAWEGRFLLPLRHFPSTAGERFKLGGLRVLGLRGKSGLRIAQAWRA